MNQPSPSQPAPDFTGQAWGDYRLLRKLGTGGMADVYLAQQQSLDRQVAMKILKPDLANDANYVQRFSNEARAAASLVHPNIVQIYEVGKYERFHFIVQEYIAGKNLAQLLKRDGAFPPGLVLDILRQVAAALCKADELRIVHRDLKPENIMLSQSGEVKVADFGLARAQSADSKTLTQVGVAMGTPLYMSPEQIEGRPVDARSDIYSLGVTCYHLLSGVPPHKGETALAIAVQHLNSTPTHLSKARFDLPRALSDLVHRMFAKQPQQRPASPGELLNELSDLAKAAASEGWAEGPENWSLVERAAARSTRSGMNAQLDELMKESAKLVPTKRKWGRVVLGLIAAVFMGLVIGGISRPRFYLAGPLQSSVPKRSSVWAQLYHAKLTESESAWLAVAEYFPEAGSYEQQLSKQGLVRHYLIVADQPRKALSVLRELRQMAVTDQSLTPFVMASLCIANQQLDRDEQAREAQSLLTAEMRDQLRRDESQLYNLLQSSLAALEE